MLPDTRQKEPFRVPKDDIRFLSRSQVDAELSQMQKMTAQEAAAAAALAVAEAEAALAEAEAASREADVAEADAEAAWAFAEAAMLTMKNKKTNKMVNFINCIYYVTATTIIFLFFFLNYEGTLLSYSFTTIFKFFASND